MKQFHVAIAIVAAIGITTSTFGDEEGQPIRQRNAGAGNFRERLLKEFDANGDGTLSESERAAIRQFMAKRGGSTNGVKRRPETAGNRIPAEVLTRFDKDGDGKLNETERRAAMKAREEYMKHNRAAGGRGMLSREELVKRFDKNGNGKIDDDERAAAREAMSKMRGQLGAGATVGNGGEARKSRIDKKGLLDKFDADGDGKLGAEERARAREEFQNRKES